MRFNSRLREEATVPNFHTDYAGNSFNSRLREEATVNFIHLLHHPGCFNSRLREEATVPALSYSLSHRFQLTPP